jgi:hypothetical protein
MTKDETGYNGWANYETWNVALWIGNDSGLYETALQHQNSAKPYADFVEEMRQYAEDCDGGSIGIETPAGVAWNDSGLDHAELNEMMAEL